MARLRHTGARVHQSVQPGCGSDLCGLCLRRRRLLQYAVSIIAHGRLNRITVDPNVMQGQACIRGLRIPVRLVLTLVACGKTSEQIVADYPELEREDISQCVTYAAWLASERTLPIHASGT